MCGRYAAADPEDLIEVFGVDLDARHQPTRSLLVTPQQPPAGSADYNVAPSKAAPVVLQRNPQERQLRLLSWGLVPSWSKDNRGAARMINARAETMLTKPAYSAAAASRRCLVPATGWYEWQRSPTAVTTAGKPRKQPFFLTRTDQAPVAFAGLYEFWKDPSAAEPGDEGPSTWLVTFAIVTTTAEPGLDRIHDRAPLVLDPDRWQRWLDPQCQERDQIEELLRPPAAGRFTSWPVSTAVNAVAHNGRELLEPAPRTELIGVLDPETGEILDQP